MKIKEAENIIRPFINECKKSKDPFLVVHFSKEEDKFEAKYDFMDKLDAMIVIKNLVKEFDIDKVLLQTAIKNN